MSTEISTELTNTELPDNQSNQPKNAKKKIAVIILALVVGYGAHNFYLGFTKKAIIHVCVGALAAIMFVLGLSMYFGFENRARAESWAGWAYINAITTAPCECEGGHDWMAIEMSDCECEGGHLNEWGWTDFTAYWECQDRRIAEFIAVREATRQANSDCQRRRLDEASAERTALLAIFDARARPFWVASEVGWFLAIFSSVPFAAAMIWSLIEVILISTDTIKTDGKGEPLEWV